MRLPRITAAKITVLAADSNLLACKLLADGLRRHPQFTIVASVTDTPSVIRAARETRPDVALISLQLQDGPLAGLAAVHELRTAQPKTRAVLLKDRTDLQIVVDAFRAGARGVFCRAESDLEDLCKCVCRVHEGQIWANTRQLEYVLQALAQTPLPLRVVDANGSNLLSKREEEVACLVGEGLGNREIATQLNLSEHTVKNYLFRIFDKLGISTRVELVLYSLNYKKAPQRSDGAGTSPTASSATDLVEADCVSLPSRGANGNRRFR